MDPKQREKVFSITLFDDQLDQFVIMCLHRVTRRPSMSYEVDQLFVSLLVNKVADTSITEAIGLNLNVAKFSRKVALKTKEEVTILRERVTTL